MADKQPQIKQSSTITGNCTPGAVGLAWMVLSCDPTKPMYFGNPAMPTVVNGPKGHAKAGKG